MRSTRLGSSLPRGVPGWEPPSDAACGEAAVAPFRGLSTDERLAWQAELVKSLIALAGPRRLVRDEDVDPLWRVWSRPLGAARPG